MKLQVFRYTLTQKNKTQGQRQGALLRIELGGFRVAYGDCFPWPSLGDLPLEAQLDSLRGQDWALLIKRSVSLALDGAAEKNRNGWNRSLPINHAFISDVMDLNARDLERLSTLGYDRLKVKLSRDRPWEWQALLALREELRRAGCLLRIDFNNTLKRFEFEAFLSDWGPDLELIDFVEDPFPYDATNWKEVHAQFGVRLALDSFSERVEEGLGGCQVVIYKPSAAGGDWLLKAALAGKQSIVVTSCLDHPLGQWHAARVCGALFEDHGARIEAGGLLSQVAYESPHLGDFVPVSGARFQMSLGGFQLLERQLERLAWRSLQEEGARGGPQR